MVATNIRSRLFDVTGVTQSNETSESVEVIGDLVTSLLPHSDEPTVT